MSYVLELPPDTRYQIAAYLSAHAAGTATYNALRDGILDQLAKIRVNPKLGSPVYGGPLETRRILRFALQVGRDSRDLQFAYRIDEPNNVVVVSGFDEAP